MQARAPQTNVATFTDLLVIVGGGSLDAELLRELYASGGHLVGPMAERTRSSRPG